MEMLQGCDDKEDSHEEKMNILYLLWPEQHWPEVLRHASPFDFLSLINSTSHLRDVLKPETTKNLLPLILPILVSSQLGISEQTLLHCRQLSHTAKKAIDNMLEEEYSPQRYWEKVTSRHVEWTVRHKNLKKFCERSGGVTDLKMTTKNPFLGRRFVIKFDTFHPINNQEMIEKFFSYMTEHGHTVSQLVCNNLRYIRYVFSLLALLPNLKVVKLYTKENIKDETEYVKPVHYPLLPHLEFLDVEGFYDHEPSHMKIPFNTAFVRHYGTQLKWINCSDRLFKGWWRFRNWYSRRLQNLEKVRVTQVGENAYVFIILKEESLPNLQEIHLHNPEAIRESYIQDVLDVMNKCAATLTSFHLHIRITRMRRNEGERFSEGSMSPSLPKLKRFVTDLSNVHTSWFWPLIQHKCENIEELSFEEEKEKDESSKESQVMIKTQAFTLLPKLKRIRITYGIRYREDRPPRRIEITRSDVKWRVMFRNEK